MFHGTWVEVTGEWFCEAVWDGPFADGGFDQTDIVAGTGGRLRGAAAVFVSSGSTVDRLHSIQIGAVVWVSNSLPGLLSAADARLDRSYSPYSRQLVTIVRGIDRYKRHLRTTRTPVQLTYFDNLVWDGTSLRVASKPGLGRDFGTFGKYHAFVQAALSRVAENSASAHRARPYQLLSTASAGYDSTTVTVLAREVGCSNVLCVDHASGADSGEPVARHLGMTPILVPKEAWRRLDRPEVPFFSADGYGGDVFFAGAECHLPGKVLLTGFHGDKLWEKVVHHETGIARGDVSGLSLSEYRLKVGMIHCPPTFWGARQIEDVNRISMSPEMAPWDVPGTYSRPIPRRIAESAGVPREFFGMRKRAVWVNLNKNPDAFLTEKSLTDYLLWVREHRADWLKRGRVPPVASVRIDKLDQAWRLKLKRWENTREGRTAAFLKRSGLNRVTGRLHDNPTFLRRHLFAWGVEQRMPYYQGLQNQ